MADTQDAIALLKADHRKVEELFEEFESAKGDGRKEKLARQICLELTVHTALEEEIFYPACEGKVEEDLLKESFVEHDAAKLLIAEIEAGNGQTDDFFDAKVKVLSEEIEHHVQEEEERGKGLFAQARKADIDLDALGAQLATRKAELMANYKASGVPQPELTTMDEVKI
ncbi:hemerythrin domain-containing protein [Sphingomonas sp.]|uniref:hemerythrin domain-containing protein n=1 Tax=Sphingomonas sp. TaxID=28214 RepID=UPI0025D81FC6|nr:hemerythrin domain-containing protein [Sphingomonas sp.]MBV9528680.1 hemerythrin domain-containing protein [Sphingomonas sp.]